MSEALHDERLYKLQVCSFGIGDTIAKRHPVGCSLAFVSNKFLDAMEAKQAGPDHAADHAALVAYLMSCVRRRDWHGVADSACDLRVLEAQEVARKK